MYSNSFLSLIDKDTKYEVQRIFAQFEHACNL